MWNDAVGQTLAIRATNDYLRATWVDLRPHSPYAWNESSSLHKINSDASLPLRPVNSGAFWLLVTIYVFEIISITEFCQAFDGLRGP